jgi:hypothetical protein
MVVDLEFYSLDEIKRKGISDSNLGLSSPIQWSRRLAPAGGGADSRSWRRVMAERGGSPKFEFSRAMVVGFR